MSASDDEFESDDETPRARRGASARTGQAPAGGLDPKRLFLYATPFTMAVLLGMGYYLSQLPDKEAKPQVVEVHFEPEIAKAKAKYEQAKSLYTAGKAIDGEAGIPKFRESEKLLHEANEIIDKVRDELEKLPPSAPDPKNPGAAAPYYPFEDTSQQITMLLVSCRKEIAARLPDIPTSGSEKESAPSPPPGRR